MAEANLTSLLANIQPILQPGTFVFCTMSEADYNKAKLNPLCFFREQEGVSVILQKEEADRLSLKYTNDWAMITCQINSDLNAVGFMASISNKLAQAGIPVNPVSAYFHDHFFVPTEKAREAMTLLAKMLQK